MKALPWILLLIALIAGYLLIGDTIADAGKEHAAWDRERDSLSAVIVRKSDSLRILSIARFERGDSLATVHDTIYLNHAQHATRDASLDSLGRMFWADPFAIAPER